MSSGEDDRLRKAPRWKVLLAGVVFPLFAAYVGWIWINGIGPQARSGSWPTATATILRSEYDPWGGRWGALRVRYGYDVDGKRYQCSRLQLNGLSTAWMLRSKSGFVTEHPVGSTLTIAYDPSDPSRATVRRGVSLDDFVIAPLLAFVGFWCGRSSWRELARRRMCAGPRAEMPPWACPVCGYNREGLSAATPCPECGHSLQQAQ